MYKQALELASSSPTENLGRVSNVSRRDFEERETFRFHTCLPCLEYLSLLIETALLLRTNRTGRVYVNFGKLSNMESVVDRYLRIADVSERVYAFGEADWKPPRHPNLRLIELPHNSQLAREWFVIADSSTLRAALVAVEEQDTNLPAYEQTLSFNALKTSDPRIVNELAATAEGLIDLSLAA
jgi:DICT domain-containing protein